MAKIEWNVSHTHSLNRNFLSNSRITFIIQYHRLTFRTVEQAIEEEIKTKSNKVVYNVHVLPTLESNIKYKLAALRSINMLGRLSRKNLIF